MELLSTRINACKSVNNNVYFDPTQKLLRFYINGVAVFRVVKFHKGMNAFYVTFEKQKWAVCNSTLSENSPKIH